MVQFFESSTETPPHYHPNALTFFTPLPPRIHDRFPPAAEAAAAVVDDAGAADADRFHLNHTCFSGFRTTSSNLIGRIEYRQQRGRTNRGGRANRGGRTNRGEDQLRGRTNGRLFYLANRTTSALYHQNLSRTVSIVHYDYTCICGIMNVDM